MFHEDLGENAFEEAEHPQKPDDEQDNHNGVEHAL